MVVSWRFGPKAGPNPWRAKTIEWLVSSPPPVFNFDQIPRVVGGPYEFGVPGARHAIMGGEEGAKVGGPEPAVAGAASGGGGGGGGGS
jgi:cytochrome c oxidase subunit 1